MSALHDAITLLTPRQRTILRLLIREHVRSSDPVGSATIRRSGALHVSTATIRNELVRLEEMGLIAQPHTSAGRVPTVDGYRYFVEQLMEQVDLSIPEQRTIRHQFHQSRLSLEQWMRLTAAVLARATQAASLVTPPHAANARFRHIELISIHDMLCLMILVLQDGSVHQEMLDLTQPISQEHLSQASNKLNAVLARQTLDEISANASPEMETLTEMEQAVLYKIARIMQQVEHRTIADVYQDGLVHVLEQPEFEDQDRVRQVMEILEQRSLLETILSRTLESNGVQIIIGGEDSLHDIYDVSLVLSPYGIRGQASGVLGILGPTRMRYGRAVSTVRYISQLMDGLMDDIYGNALPGDTLSGTLGDTPNEAH